MRCEFLLKSPSLFHRLKDSAETVSKWNARKDQVENEMAGLSNHAWAGAYYYGDGLGANSTLTLAPKTGFVFTWTGCLGVYDRNYGTAEVLKDGLIKLTPAFPNSREGFRGTAELLVPVRWGARKYLIEPAKMSDFCNSVNAGHEPRCGAHGMFYLGRNDWNKHVNGKPQVPGQFASLLLAKPLTAVISGVQGFAERASFCGPYRTADVILTSQSASSIQVGMELFPADWKKARNISKVKITAVDGPRITACLEQHRNEPLNSRDLIGLAFSTSSIYSDEQKESDPKIPSSQSSGD
jgi:hypothetical protein